MNTKLSIYIEELKNFDFNDHENFYYLFAKGIKLLKLRNKKLSKKFGVSLSTINRWKKGKNSPHRLFRKAVISYFLKEILKK